MTSSPTDPTPPFWDWSLAVWSRPEVEAFCLRLQDEAGVFVPALLFAGWCAQFNRIVSPAALNPLQVSTWATGVMGPLRTARHAARDLQGPDGAGYRRLRSCELALERDLMEQLAEIAQPAAQAAAGVERADWLLRFQKLMGMLEITLAQEEQEAIAHLLLD